jgi:hypothetical protein
VGPCRRRYQLTPPLSGCDRRRSRFPSSVRAFASGRRSAVFAHNGVLVRVKGCGDESAGFPLAGSPGSVRGCMFEDTAARELFMCGVADVALKARGLDQGCANTPLGLFVFPSAPPPDAPPHLAWAAPEVAKFAVVCETKGDRRLGDHLIAGLAALVRRADVDLPAVERYSAAWARALDVPTATACEAGMQVVDFLPVCAPSAPPLPGWEDLSVLLLLAWRLGREVGLVLAALHDAGVCWGTYQDELGFHCNAHVNNLVVLREGPWLLAPLDFDMAFTRAMFDPGLAAQAGVGAGLFPREFDELLAFEKVMGMRTTLAGSDFTSTGVTGDGGHDHVNGAPQGPDGIKLLLLRDELVAGFDAALGPDVHEMTPEEWAKCRQLVVRALQVTKDML